MDDTVRNLLHRWNMPPSIIQTFYEERVDEFVLRNLTKEYIEKLIRPVGLQIKFIKQWEVYMSGEGQQNDLEKYNTSKESINTPDIVIEKTENFEEPIDILNAEVVITGLNAQSPNISNDVPQVEVQNIPTCSSESSKFNLRVVLQQTLAGQLLLATYNQKRTLSDADRNVLANCIINAELRNDLNRTISPSRISFLADCIVQLFPTEDKAIWFYRETKNNRTIRKGKLVHRSYNVRRKLIEKNLILKHNRKMPEELPRQNVVISFEEDTSDVEDNVRWLEHNTQPWTQVVSYWSTTCAARLKSLKISSDKTMTMNTILNYYSKFPALRDSAGYSLLEIDFEYLYPYVKLKLYGEWEKFARFVIMKVHQNESPFVINDIHSDSGRLKILLSLAKMFRVITVVTDKKIGQYRPSRQEIVDSFILHVKNITDVQPALSRRRERLEKFSIAMQPQIVIVGTTLDTITHTYVVYDRIFYPVKSPFNAVDVTFKCFHALRIAYSIECKQIWLFLQKVVYDIHTDRDEPSSTTRSLIHEYETYVRHVTQ